MNIDIVRQDWDALAGRRHQFSADFYRRLFERQPHLRHMFPDELGPQSERMVELLSQVVRFADHIDLIRPYLVQVGYAHRKLGIRDDDVQAFLQTLLDSVSEACGGFDEKHETAWREVLDETIAPLFDEGLETGRAHKSQAAAE